METRLNIQQISQISVTVHDLPRATAFYKDVLGLKAIYEAANMSRFDCQGIRLILSIPEKPEYDHPSSVIYFKVDDIQASCQCLIKLDVAMMGQPHRIGKLENTEYWMVFFKDPDQNVLALTSELILPQEG